MSDFWSHITVCRASGPSAHQTKIVFVTLHKNKLSQFQNTTTPHHEALHYCYYLHYVCSCQAEGSLRGSNGAAEPKDAEPMIAELKAMAETKEGPDVDRSLGNDFNDHYHNSGYHGKACRDGHHGNGREGHDYHKYHGYTLEGCFEKCSEDDSCKQFEYSDDNNSCEIWYNKFGNYEQKHGFYCFHKN